MNVHRKIPFIKHYSALVLYLPPYCTTWWHKLTKTKCRLINLKYFMIKLTGILSLLVLFTITACSNDKTAEVKKEVIIVPVSSAPVVVEAPEKNTTISVDKNGVKVVTKKVDVSVNSEKKK